MPGLPFERLPAQYGIMRDEETGQITMVAPNRQSMQGHELLQGVDPSKITYMQPSSQTAPQRGPPTQEESLGKDYQTAFDALQRKYKIELEGIQTQLLTGQQFINKRSQLNAKYKDKIDDLDTARSAKQEEINQIRQSTQPGPERQTQMREKFERGAAKQNKFSLPQLTGLGQMISGIKDGKRVGFAEAAEEESGWSGKKTRKGLEAQYLELLNLSRISDPEQQKQFDDLWNMKMADDPRFSNWFDTKGNVPDIMRIAGTQGPGAEAMRKKALGVKTGTPMGRAISGILRGPPGTAGKPSATYSSAGFGGYPTPTKPQETRPQATTPQSTQRIKVKHPDGREGTIPFSEWADKQRQGFTRI